MKLSSIAYIEPKGGGPTAQHVHSDHDHLFIVVRGRAKILLGNEEKIVNANESFLVKGAIHHSVWNDCDETTIMIGLTVKG